MYRFLFVCFISCICILNKGYETLPTFTLMTLAGLTLAPSSVPLTACIYIGPVVIVISRYNTSGFSLWLVVPCASGWLSHVMFSCLVVCITVCCPVMLFT